MPLTTTLAHVLLLNYPLPADRLAARLPAPLEVDTHCGSAWISVVAFQQQNLALCGPLGPVLRFPQVNYRAYVRWRGQRGVHFWRVNAAQPWLPPLCRILFGMPMRSQPIQLRAEFDAPDHAYRCWRLRAPDLEISARSTPGQPDDPDWFLQPVRGFFTHWDRGVRRLGIQRTISEVLNAETTVARADFPAQLGVPDITAPRSALLIPRMQFAFVEFPPEFA
jgi:uncharacterized protein YqjF (DUF2071 family)